MFLPFLPLILALFSVSTLAQQKIRPEWGSQISPVFITLGLVIFSLILAHLPSKKETRIFYSSPRRLIMLTLWFGSTYISAIDQILLKFFKPFSEGEIFSLGILILEYWGLDALCMTKLVTWNRSGYRQYGKDIIDHLRLQLPLLLLVVTQIIWLKVMFWIMPETQGWMWHSLEMIIGLGLVAIIAPWIMVVGWGAIPLKSSESRKIIQLELEDNGVPVNQILCWPEKVLPYTTAGVIGVFRGCRYLLISPRLLNILTSTELRAVIAHEAGHLRQYHLLFFVLAYAGFIQLLLLGTLPLDWMEWTQHWQISWEIVGALSLLAILLFLRFGIGFLSRNFERQADCNSLDRVGLEPMQQALLKVSWINGINPEEDNWHHYGVMRRIHFLSQCQKEDPQCKHHHRYVLRLKIFCAIMAILFFSANGFSTTEQFQLYWWKQKLAQQPEISSPKQLSLLKSLSYWYYKSGDYHQSVTLYEQILEVHPKDAQTLNNLAWLLASRSDEFPERLQESVELALQALKQEEAAYIWDTLAEAYSKTHHTKQAYQAAEQAWKLAQEQEANDSEPGLTYYQERLKAFQEKFNQNSVSTD